MIIVNKNNNQGAIVKTFLLMTAIIGFIGGFALSGDLKDMIYKASKNDEKKESEEGDKTTIDIDI